MLVALIGEEMFHEMGVANEISHGLEGLIGKDGADTEQQYWALDGLVFADMKLGHMDRAAHRLDAMERLIDSGALGEANEINRVSGRSPELKCAAPGDVTSNSRWPCTDI